ncbi:2-oxoglutarate and iron-dependent oxygenase domain-containing protein [Halobacteriovorax sp. GB3]|uniref:isopenicillin N synthase family dioxygenase n=1 Tax=Halobacteriovorax sp. GB3 TaxID=2719615 RepID=UPI00235FF24D|nr:2-oxoglutarate and iron-dependent oxygenase domain-containing protein [Halobacteriovorax sp. GB3]MDD0853066.1 2-oxoglutarate and iron-dependent oxygenase domain-containing protein [Halobacteriovorax sp. GB3]
MSETVRKVPELSLLSYVNGSESDRKEFVDKLFIGLKDYGFIVLTDHTVDQKKVDHAYELLKKFYAQPVEVKMNYCGDNGGQRGYTPFKTEHAKDNENPDLKEFWHVGRELSATSQYKGVYPENVWPDSEVPGFKDAFMSLYSAMDETANHLLEAIGMALDLPKDFFAEMVSDGNSILRAIHYPPTVGEDTKSSIRAAAHEDINLITMLVGATDSGLELLDRDGTWLPVQSAPGQIVVDTGDMMSRITNDVLPATTHRVVNPKDDNSERYSMPYFVHPHSNALLSCIASCIGEGAKYPDITAGDFLIQRLKEIGLYK